MNWPRSAKGVVLATQAVLFLAIPGFSETRPTTQAIFYVTGEDDRYEMRVYHPLEQTRTILELPGEPSNIYWTRDFKRITFRVGDDVFESDWRIESEARQAVTLPSFLDSPYRRITVWYDTDSAAWRYYEIQYPADAARQRNYSAKVFQYNEDAEEWEKLVEKETHGCEQGDGSGCGYEVHEYTQGQSWHPRQSELSEQMRLGRLMDELGREYEGSMDGKDFWFEFGGREISVGPLFGDSLHATAPVKWRAGSESKVVFPAGFEYPCMDQIGLTRIGNFLLVATEWYGRCGRVIDLRTGETIHELPESSRGAVVVPWPEGP